MVGLDAVEQLLDLGHEPQVGHPVGLVDDEHLDRPQRHLTALEQVDEPAGRADDGVDTLAERPDLRLHRHAAVHGGDADAAELAQRGQDVLDLVGELACRREHERPRGLGTGPPDALEQWEPEGERLARAGLGFTAQVAAGEGVGDGEGLDGERFGDAVARKCGDEILGDAERLERGLH